MQDVPGLLRVRFANLLLRERREAGDVYAATDYLGTPATLAVLSEQAARDPQLSRAFVEAARKLAALDPTALHSQDLTSTQPWVAVRSGQGADAGQLLASLSAVDETAPAADEPATAGVGGEDDRPRVFLGPVGGGQADRSAEKVSAEVAEILESWYDSLTPRTDDTTSDGQAAADGPADDDEESRPRYNRRLVAALVGLTIVSVALGTLFRYLESRGVDLDSPIVGSGDTVSPPRVTVPLPTITIGPLLDPIPGRDEPPVLLYGPKWEEGDSTVAFSFPGMPFTLRIPPTWRCDLGAYEPIPNAQAWRCVDTDPAGEGQRVYVLIWPCPTVCTEEERQMMVRAWLDEPDRAEYTEDGLAAYVETFIDDRGYHSVNLSWFAADPRDPDVLRWHIGLHAEGPLGSEVVPFKILNGILVQLR